MLYASSLSRCINEVSEEILKSSVIRGCESAGPKRAKYPPVTKIAICHYKDNPNSTEYKDSEEWMLVFETEGNPVTDNVTVVFEVVETNEDTALTAWDLCNFFNSLSDAREKLLEVCVSHGNGYYPSVKHAHLGHIGIANPALVLCPMGAHLQDDFVSTKGCS